MGCDERPVIWTLAIVTKAIFAFAILLVGNSAYRQAIGRLASVQHARATNACTVRYAIQNIMMKKIPLCCMKILL